MTIFSPHRDRKAYYKKQSEDLKRRAEETRQQTDNYPEANRLDGLAKEADEQAASIDEEMKEAGK
jgi:hypothetical protein